MASEQVVTYGQMDKSDCLAIPWKAAQSEWCVNKNKGRNTVVSSLSKVCRDRLYVIVKGSGGWRPVLLEWRWRGSRACGLLLLLHQVFPSGFDGDG